jgi:hypothetical protein
MVVESKDVGRMKCAHVSGKNRGLLASRAFQEITALYSTRPPAFHPKPTGAPPSFNSRRRQVDKTERRIVSGHEMRLRTLKIAIGPD